MVRRRGQRSLGHAADGLHVLCHLGAGQEAAVTGLGALTDFDKDARRVSHHLRHGLDDAVPAEVAGGNLDDEIFVLSDIDTVNTSLTTVPSLFKSLRLMNDEEIIPININSLFLKNLNSLKYVPNMFEGIYMKHAIPFNIFNKRYKVESRKNYFILNNDNEYVQARLAEYVYNNEIVNMNNTFAEITFEDKTSATFTHDTESANNYNVIDRNYVFNANVSEMCVQDGTMADPVNGQFKFEYIIEKFLALYDKNFDMEFKKMSKSVSKHTNKYTRKK